MKPIDTKRLYDRACADRRMQPSQGEFEAWHRRLRNYDVRDVEAAIEAWDSSPEKNVSGELKSKWVPKATELEPLVIAAQNKREAKSREPEDYVARECRKPEGCGYRCSGWTKNMMAERKNCPKCGKPMHEVLRERAVHA